MLVVALEYEIVFHDIQHLSPALLEAPKLYNSTPRVYRTMPQQSWRLQNFTLAFAEAC
jgi:hypothetical protein